MDKLQLGIGRTGTWTVETLDYKGVDVEFAGTEPLAAAVWYGGDQAPLFSPTVAWVAPVAPSATTHTITLTISAAQTVGLTPGLYRIDIDLSTPLTDIFEGWLELTPTPGVSAAPAPVYCTYADMLDVYSGLGDFEEAAGSQFLAARKHARAKIDRVITSWYVGLLARHRDYEGYTVSLPAAASIKSYLDANDLEVTDVVREIAARYAVAYSLETTVGLSDKDTQYKVIGRENRNAANRLFEGLVVRITDVTAGVDFLIGEETLYDAHSSLAMAFPSLVV